MRHTSTSSMIRKLFCCDLIMKKNPLNAMKSVYIYMYIYLLSKEQKPKNLKWKPGVFLVILPKPNLVN